MPSCRVMFVKTWIPKEIQAMLLMLQSKYNWCDSKIKVNVYGEVAKKGN